MCTGGVGVGGEIIADNLLIVDNGNISLNPLQVLNEVLDSDTHPI